MTFFRNILSLWLSRRTEVWDNCEARERDFLVKQLVANGSSMAYEHGWRLLGRRIKGKVRIGPFFQISTLYSLYGTYYLFPFPPSALSSSSISIAFVSASDSDSAFQNSKEMASSHLYFSLSLLFLAAVCTFHHQVRFLILSCLFAVFHSNSFGFFCNSLVFL